MQQERWAGAPVETKAVYNYMVMMMHVDLVKSIVADGFCKVHNIHLKTSTTTEITIKQEAPWKIEI